MTKAFCYLAVLLCALGLLDGGQTSVSAADQGIVATVNDIPITSFDIDQRLRLMDILGDKREATDARKKARGVQPGSFLSLMIGSKHQDGRGVSDEEATSQAFTFLLAGYETTVHTSR